MNARTHRYALAAAIGAVVLVAGACESVPGSYDGTVPLESLTGTWAADHVAGEPKDAQMRLRFGTAEGRWHGTWINVGPAGVEVTRFRYEFRQRPGRTDQYYLDMHAFDAGPLQGQWMYGLLEWEGEDARVFRLDLEPAPESTPGARPETLSSDARTFRRVAE